MISTSGPFHGFARGFALAACLASSCAFAADWTGTMSCGELQNAPNARSKEPFTGNVTLRVEGNRAVLERAWKNGAEKSEGTFARGRPLQLVGTGSFTATPDKPWRVRATLTQRGDRYEGPGVLESPDGTRKFRDCSFELTLAGAGANAKAEAPPSVPAQPAPPRATAVESPVASDPPRVAASEPNSPAPPEQPKAAEPAAPVPPPAPKQIKTEPANTESPQASFGVASLVLVFLLGAAAMALVMIFVRQLGQPRTAAQPASTPAGTSRRTGFMETLQGLVGAIVLAALVYWGYNALFGQPQGSLQATGTDSRNGSDSKLRPGKLEEGVAASPAHQTRSPTTAASTSLSAEESAIAERIRAKPTDREIVRLVRGKEIFPGVEMHYVLDQFGESPRCLVEFSGRMADGRETPARRFFLVYTVESKGLKSLTTESFHGPPNPLRLTFDQSTEYVPMPVQSNGAAGMVVSGDLSAKLATAREVTVLHGRDASGEISFTYDLANFVHARNIAMALCGPK